MTAGTSLGSPPPSFGPTSPWGMPAVRTTTLLVALAACGGPPAPAAPGRAGEPGPVAMPPAVLVGAGDIAVCGFGNAERTARLLDGIDGTVITLGDNAYPDGTPAEFTNCYGPTWGRHKARTRPSPGNHDYNTPGAAGYFAYFGDQAGSPGLGYYGYTAGAWRVFSLNSNVAAGRGSAQYEWLRSQLAATSASCVIAYWHHPVFSSGFDGDLPQMRDIWALLYEHRAEIVLSGHSHHYERLAPMNPQGQPDGLRGLRLFIVGTGGSAHTELVTRKSTSESFESGVIGVLKLTLRDGDYSWEFVGAPGYRFTDSGVGTCS